MKTINAAGLSGKTGLGIGVTGGSSHIKGSGDKNSQIKNGSIFAGNINSMSTDKIEQKRAQARKQATKAIMDQFASDNQVADALDESRARIKELKGIKSEYMDEQDYYLQERENLKDLYQIEDDSQEQQDLDLIRKANKALKTGQLGDLSKEELERVANMGELTEYQSRSLEYDPVINHYDSLMEDCNKEIRAINSGISATKLEMLKNDGMVKANKAADKILEAGSKAVIGMLMEDAKKHIDEEMAKLVEAAKKAAEKKEEEEERLEAIKEDKEDTEELVEEIGESTSEQDKLTQEIKKILREQELIEEDIKGLVVDDLL